MSEIENNQPKPRGGARPNSGRKKGSCTAKTREIANKALESGLTPLEYMLEVLRDESLSRQERMDAAKSAAPYVHPRLTSTEVSGNPDAPVALNLNVSFK